MRIAEIDVVASAAAAAAERHAERAGDGDRGTSR